MPFSVRFVIVIVAVSSPSPFLGRAASRAPLRQSRRREQEAEGEGGEITLGGSHLSTLSYMLDQEMSIQQTRK